MITGLGIDIVDISRIKQLIHKWNERFLTRVFTECEVAYCLKKSNPAEHLAARFAAKEAGLKMLGTGLRGLSWQQLEVINDTGGRPELILSGRAAELARQRGISSIHLSISHDKGLAIAQVIGEG